MLDNDCVAVWGSGIDTLERLQDAERMVTLLSVTESKRKEQIWICHYAQNLRIFTGLKRLMS